MFLAGRNVLVVGASAGIGREIAAQAVAAGASVVGAARRPIDVDGVSGVLADVSQPDDCARLVDDALAVLGRLDTLVYAPALLPLGRIADVDAEAWHRVLGTNVVGAALVTRAALPALAAAAGRAVFLSSDGVPRPRPGLVPYLASKAALDTLITGLRVEVPQVAFTRVVVGPTLTDISNGWDPALAGELLAGWQAGGWLDHGVMTPATVAAEIVRVLASEARIDDLAVAPGPA